MYVYSTHVYRVVWLVTLLLLENKVPPVQHSVHAGQPWFSYIWRGNTHIRIKRQPYWKTDCVLHNCLFNKSAQKKRMLVKYAHKQDHF